jgi:hypothetical protein
VRRLLSAADRAECLLRHARPFLARESVQAIKILLENDLAPVRDANTIKIQNEFAQLLRYG